MVCSINSQNITLENHDTFEYDWGNESYDCVYKQCDVCGKDIHDKVKKESNIIEIPNWNNSRIFLDNDNSYITPNCYGEQGKHCIIGGRNLFICPDCYNRFIEPLVDKQKEKEIKKLESILKDNEKERKKRDKNRKKLELEKRKNEIDRLKNELKNMEKFGVPYNLDSAKAHNDSLENGWIKLGDTLYFLSDTIAIKNMILFDTLAFYSNNILKLTGDTIIIDTIVKCIIIDTSKTKFIFKGGE